MASLPQPLPPARRPAGGSDSEPGAEDQGGGGGIAAPVVALVRAVLQVIVRAGRVSVETAGDALEGPSRSLVRRGTDAAWARPRAVEDRAALARALAEKPSGPMVGGASAAAVAARVAQRFGPLRVLGRRTPVWMVAALVPALHASITWGVEELRLVASLLQHRASAAGVVADPDRVRRAAAQLVAGQSVDPSAEPRHSQLAAAWLQRAVRATLPLAKGVSTQDPDGLAAAAAAVDPATLAAPAGG